MNPKPSSPEFPPSASRDLNTPNLESTSPPADSSSSSSSTATITQLPSGRCMFIATADKRCSCHAFQRSSVLPGAYCHQCGHQASYHSMLPHDECVPAPRTSIQQEATYPCYSPTCTQAATLLRRRLYNLETSQKQYETELLRERHARQQDVRALREQMFRILQIVEREIVPRRFADVEDRMDSLMDQCQRLREKVVSVDDFSMALEDRVIELEQREQLEDDEKGEEEEEEEEEDDDDDDDDETCDSDGYVPVKNEPGGSAVPGDIQQRPNQLSRPAEIKDRTSVKRKRGVRFSLPNPPPLVLSE